MIGTRTWPHTSIIECIAAGNPDAKFPPLFLGGIDCGRLKFLQFGDHGLQAHIYDHLGHTNVGDIPRSRGNANAPFALDGRIDDRDVMRSVV